jgi:hypothetical protein
MDLSPLCPLVLAPLTLSLLAVMPSNYPKVKLKKHRGRSDTLLKHLSISLSPTLLSTCQSIYYQQQKLINNYKQHHQVHTQCLHLIINPTHPWMEQQSTTVIKVLPLAETVKLLHLPNLRTSTDTLQMILPESRGSQLLSLVSWYVSPPTFKIRY